MKRTLIAMAIVLLAASAVPLFAKDPVPIGGGSSFYVNTGNGSTQTLGGKSGSRSQKGLSNAAQNSQSVKQGKGSGK